MLGEPLLLVEVVAVAGGDFQVAAADAVDEPVFVVDAARRPSGERAFQQFGLAETGSLWIPLNVEEQFADASGHLHVPA
ncbi:hypothetical protein [Actinoplanes flavus]|uniref:hypothetical protein n=1 Tax=Actinoplanes flavus TaxID=2820290 RepID=UPI003FD77F13